ncbi:MAG: hypothetical protein K6T31_07275, partial [Alicyclobacillus sp.]|nr:hypothetical protein [Alicyclobacillus sp.]
EKNIGTMLLSGELDATLLYLPEKNLVDRSRIDLRAHPDIAPLFPDALTEGRRYFAKTGVFPVNHCVVIRRSLAEQYPWLVLNLYHAFVEAKQESLRVAQDWLTAYERLGQIQVDKDLWGDPYPYGVQANRTTLENIAQYAWEQGLTPRKVALDEVFDERTWDL